MKGVEDIQHAWPSVSIGIHPHQTDPGNKSSIEEQIKQLRKLAENKEVIAIGECGLDFSEADPELEKNRSAEEQEFLFLFRSSQAESPVSLPAFPLLLLRYQMTDANSFLLLGFLS